MYALMSPREACASRLFLFRLKHTGSSTQRAASIFAKDFQLLASLYLAQFIVWRELRRGGGKRVV
ncbi:MAG: hypothetical protein LC794_18115 [Acidobacteria bacterium]|nr:hypothetical protein [Acidobacteriota bacterium]